MDIKLYRYDPGSKEYGVEYTVDGELFEGVLKVAYGRRGDRYFTYLDDGIVWDAETPENWEDIETHVDKNLKELLDSSEQI